MKRTIVNKWNTAFWESGGTERTIVFVHGNSSSRRIFTRQFNSALGDRYRLIAPDLPGHGETKPVVTGEEEYSVRLCTEFLLDFASAMNCKDIIFVGHSFGGHLLLQSHHDLKKITAGMIIFGATPLANPPRTETAFLAHHVVPLLFQETLTAQEVKTWQDCLFSSSCSPPDFYRRDIAGTNQKFRSSIGASLAANDFNDEIEVISNMEQPLAVIHGQNDQLINFDYIKELKFPTLWRNKIDIIPDAGHTPQWEQPEAFNTLLDQFVNELE